MARPTAELPKRDFLRLITGQKTDIPSQRQNNLFDNLPTLTRGAKKEEQKEEDDEIWLERTGLELYKPQSNLLATDVLRYRVPLTVPEGIQLPNAHSLKGIVRPIINNIYPSLSNYLGEDATTEAELYAHFSAKSLEGGGAQIFRKPVKIIYAMAPPNDLSNGIAGLTRMQVSGNQVEYAIIIRLNPSGVRFTSQDEFRNWIQSVYVHEMTHVRQKDLRWEQLLINSLSKKQPPSQSEIYTTLDNPANKLYDEAQAYWAGMRYAQMIRPAWFDTATPPNFTGLKKPFLKLQALGMDPLIAGEKISSTSSYDEHILENLWLYSVYFNLNYDGLVESSKTAHGQVSIIEQCFAAELIPEYEFMRYLQQVDQIKYYQYKAKKEAESNIQTALQVTKSFLTPEAEIAAAATIGFIALLLAIKRRGK